MKGLLRAMPGYVVTIPVVLIAMVLGERLQFMRDLDGAIAASRQTYLNLVIVLMIVGWGGFFGAIIYGVGTRMPSRRLGQPIPEDKEARGSFDIEVSFREMKQAWREQGWRNNRVWRFTFFMFATAVVAIIGLFGLFFVLGPGGIRLITATAVLYATVRTVQGFIVS